MGFDFPQLKEEKEEMPVKVSQAQLETTIQPKFDMLEVLKPIKERIETYKNELPAEINSKEEQEQATKVLSLIKKDLKEIDSKRKFILEPINSLTKEINTIAKATTSILEDMETTTKNKMSVFANKLILEQKKAEQEERERVKKEQEKINHEAQKLGCEPVVIPEIVQEKPKTTIRTETGTSYTKEVWNFKITDISKVPLDYLIVDEKNVREAIKNGIRNIDGLEIFSENKIVIR